MNADRERPVGIRPFPDTGDFTVRCGEHHCLVTVIQIMLDELKIYYDDFGAVTGEGYYDSATERAVKAFQRASGIPETGCVDVSTWNRLAEEYNAAIYENMWE
ncbi:MAG: peptidoglycan-binding protein [Clostridia bacterium]|nr:peptidoglycan-binding protein [Clostridia bacterium]